MAVKLGSSSKPATVSLGGSSGKTTTTPATSSSPSSSAAAKLSTLEKMMAPVTQAKAAPAPAPSITEFIKSTPAPQPSYENEIRLEFYPKTTTVTPAKTAPAAPAAPASLTPAQAIQASIASSVNVPISPETLASRNVGLKPLSAPAPATGLGSKVGVVGGTLEGGVQGVVDKLSAPAPVKTITYTPLTPTRYSLQETLAISEAMRQATELVTPPSINVKPVPLDEIETAPAAKVAAVANSLLENTNRFNQALTSATKAPASIDVSSKVEAALKNSLKTGNTDRLQQTTNTILNAVNKVADQATQTAVKKIDTEKAALYTLSNAALNNLLSVANNEFNKANTVKTATDLKSVSDKSVSKIVEIGNAADQAAQRAKLNISDNIKQMLTGNKVVADNAVQTATKLNAIKISPGQSASSVASAIYSQLYPDKAPAATVAERMGAINDALKPYIKGGVVDHTKLASIRQDLLPSIQVEDWSKVSTGDDAEDARRGIGKYAAKSATAAPETKTVSAATKQSVGATPATADAKAGGGAGARSETKEVDTGIFSGLGKSLSGIYNDAVKKLFGTGATAEAKPKAATKNTTTVSSKTGSELDINKTYVTPSGNIVPGSKLTKSEFAKGGYSEYTKPAPVASTPTPTSVSKPAGAVAVKGSVEGRVVHLDPTIYQALKSTGYLDNQIADSLASGKMGIYASNDGKVKIGMQSSVPNAAMSDSGLFTVEPYKTVKDSAGQSVPVNEWSYRKTAYLGLSDNEIGDLGTDILNRAATLDVGTYTKPSTGWVDNILTEIGTVFQVPDMRAADSGMFTLKPLTKAQIPDKTEDPWGYADWLSKKPYMELMGEGYENGYQVQPTVQGLIQLNSIAKDLAKPGASLKDVPTVGGLNQYEIFKNALTYADKNTVAEIAKNNPRLILGASTDTIMQPVLETKLGSTEYKQTLDKAMTPAEKKYVDGMEKERGFGTALAFLPTSAAGHELMPYSSAQTLAVAESVLGPLTPNKSVNAAIFLPLTIGVSPIRLVSKGGDLIDTLKLVKAADGTVDAYRGTELIGKVGAGATNPDIIRLETLDGRAFELSKDGKQAVEIAATKTPVPVIKETVTGKPIIPVAKAAETAVSPTAPGVGIRAADVKGGLLATPTDAKAAATARDTTGLTRSVTSEPITAETLAARNEGLKPIGASSEKTISFAGTRTGAATETKFFDMKKGTILDEGFKPFDVVDPVGNRFTIAKVRETGVMETTDGKYLVDIDGKGNYYQVHKDYVPAKKVALTVDESGNPIITKVSRPGSVDTWQITYTDDFGNVQDVVTTRPITTNDDALALATEWDARLKSLPEQYQGTGSHAPTSVSDEMLGGPDGYGGEMGDAGPIGGGGGYVDDATGGSIVTGQDVSQWAYNQNWGTELRSLDNGKTWQVKDPETGNILSTTEYEELVLKRTADRSPKYDAELNTYTKLNKDGSKVYQDSAGNWVSKADLDAERAAIARNNPTYTYGIDETKNNARTRTNSVTQEVQYMDPQTGNWLSKEQFDKLMEAEEAPIWNSEGGYYYFRNKDGTFEILNPYTNVRQTPEEYGKYLSDRLAATTPTTTTPTITTPTTTTPTEYVPSYVAPTQSELSTLYNDMIASLAAREGGVEGVADAWTRFTQTADFGQFAQSGDVSLLAKAKNGEILTETEIARIQYLRSQMSDAARIAFDEAVGDAPINMMPLSEFQNHVTASKDSIKNLSDADIKSSNLGPEKEIIVHQAKAEANMDDFLQFNEFKEASKADQDVIMDEIRYFIGEPTTTPNLLEKFNAIKATWTAKATLAWNKIVESLKSAKELISQMPASWLDENADFSMAELILGNSKYSDILVVTGTKGPTKASLAKAFEKALQDGHAITGANGWQAAPHKFKKMDGWAVRSPEGEFQFIRKNDIVFSADEAMNVASTPVKMFFWEKPVNVPTDFRVPENASGSKIVAISKADPYAADEAVWKGLTESGGLDFDMTKDFVKIDLLTEDGILWSTVREADKSNAFQIGRTVEVVEKDAVRIGEMSGIDLQRLDADTFKALVDDPNVQALIRGIPDEDLQYLTKYLDETRAKMVDDVRKSPEITPEVVPTETPSIKVPEETPSTRTPETAPDAITPESLASEYQEAQRAVAAKTAERIAVEDELSDLGRQIQELGSKLEAAPAREKAGIKSQIDGLKAQVDALKNRARRLNQEVYDSRNVQQARGNQIINGQTTVDDLIRQLDGLSVRDGRAALDEALAKSDDLKAYLRNTSREEAESLAMAISEKLGSDRSAAEKIMGFHYQGAVSRIDDATRAKMSATDQEYIRKAMTRQLNQNDYQQVTRIVDNAKAYEGVSVGADLGRLKLDNILDSSMANKSDELRKLLEDPDVRAALKDEAFADEAFNKVYDVDPVVGQRYQRAGQDAIISDIKAHPNYNSLSGKQKEFIEAFYSKRIITPDDLETLAQIREILPMDKFTKFIRGSVLGSAGAVARWAYRNKFKITGSLIGGWAVANSALFIYFAAEEGVQSLIQLTGYNVPEDMFAEQMNAIGIPAINSIKEKLAPFDWFLDNVPFARNVFPAPDGFKWFMDWAALGQIADKLGKLERAGVWVKDEGCDSVGEGCWGHIRPESERPQYWALHPETIAFCNGDLVRRIYDMQDDGSVGPNNMIAKGLGITDPNEAIAVGLGHMIAAGNQGAKDTLTKEFTSAYNQLVKGGAESELANQAYMNAKANITAEPATGPVITPDNYYVDQQGHVIKGSDVKDPSAIIGQMMPDGTVKSLTTVGSTSPVITMDGLTPQQRAVLGVAPTSIDAVSRYAQYNGSQPQDAIVWRAIFTNADGSINMKKLESAYPDMTPAQITAIFQKEAVSKTISNELAAISDPVVLAAKIKEYKASGLVDDNARIEQYMPAEQAAIFTARQNNPANFKVTATGTTVSWIDDTGYPHTTGIIQSGKLLNPLTGQYDIDQKKTTSDGSEYTIDTGKYAEFINSGSTDIEAFLANDENYNQTWRGSGSKTSGGGGGGGSGGYSSGRSGGSTYSKSTGETGIFIDAAGLNADVYEGTERIGSTDEIISVEAGIHTITIKKDGYKPYTLPVQVYSGSIARKSVTLYQDTTPDDTKSRAVRFVDAMGGIEAITPDHIVYAYAIARSNTELATTAKAEATPKITGNWAFVADDVKELIALYREA